jgi:hypothetical protein
MTHDQVLAMLIRQCDESGNIQQANALRNVLDKVNEASALPEGLVEELRDSFSNSECANLAADTLELMAVELASARREAVLGRYVFEISKRYVAELEDTIMRAERGTLQ